MERTVLKIFGSLGPAGSFVTLTEKLIRVLFYQAYDLGDPARKESEAYTNETKEIREKFVHELFEQRGTIERRISAPQEKNRKLGYEQLAQICGETIESIVEIEKSRLGRERIFQQKGTMAYKQLVEQSKKVMGDTTDNIVKMAMAIVAGCEQPPLVYCLEAILQIDIDSDADEERQKGTSARQQAENRAKRDLATISQRVSKVDAERLLGIWKKIVIAEERKTGQQDDLLEDQTKMDELKNQLFIESNQDSQDAFLAFEAYNLKWKITKKDRKKYGN